MRFRAGGRSRSVLEVRDRSGRLRKVFRIKQKEKVGWAVCIWDLFSLVCDISNLGFLAFSLAMGIRYASICFFFLCFLGDVLDLFFDDLDVSSLFLAFTKTLLYCQPPFS